DCGARLDLCEPAFEVREIRDVLPLTNRLHPWIARDVGDRIVARDERTIGEALVEHGVEAPGFAHVAIDRVRVFLGRIVPEMMVLPRERPEPAHLPVEPLQAFPAAAQ